MMMKTALASILAWIAFLSSARSAEFVSPDKRFAVLIDYQESGPSTVSQIEYRYRDVTIDKQLHGVCPFDVDTNYGRIRNVVARPVDYDEFHAMKATDGPAVNGSYRRTSRPKS
jgi:hypothetical protein